MRLVLPALVLSGLALAGCGGGGSSGGILPNISVPFQGPGTTVVYQGPASGGPALSSATFTAGTGITAMGLSPGDTGISNITLTTDNNGNIATITLSFAATGGGGPPLPAQTFAAVSQGSMPLTAIQFANLVAAVAASPAGTVNAAFQGTVAGLNSSAFGPWIRSSGGGNYDIGMYSFGPETPVMPVAGTATFNGTTLGFGSNAGAPFTFTGTAMIIVNFGANSVPTLQFTGITPQDVNDGFAGPAIANITNTAPGVIVGNKYTVPIGNGTVAGMTNGTFYGAGALETGGVWTATNVGNTLNLIGSFGAHR